MVYYITIKNTHAAGFAMSALKGGLREMMAAVV